MLPDGRAFNIRDSIASLAFRNGAHKQKRYTPGKPVTVTLTLWPIIWQLPAGAQLRLDISSSNFPAYHAHPNRAGVWSTIADPVVASQTIVTGPKAKSVVRIPMLGQSIRAG